MTNKKHFTARLKPRPFKTTAANPKRRPFKTAAPLQNSGAPSKQRRNYKLQITNYKSPPAFL